MCRGILKDSLSLSQPAVCRAFYVFDIIVQPVLHSRQPFNRLRMTLEVSLHLCELIHTEPALLVLILTNNILSMMDVMEYVPSICTPYRQYYYRLWA